MNFKIRIKVKKIEMHMKKNHLFELCDLNLDRIKIITDKFPNCSCQLSIAVLCQMF